MKKIELLNTEDLLDIYDVDAKVRDKAKYAAEKAYFHIGDHRVKFRKLPLNDFDFVHGSYEELMNGKVCVVRDWCAYHVRMPHIPVLNVKMQWI